MAIGLSHYLAVAAILFTIGVFGIFVNRKNVIVILMSVELILLAVNINFVAFSTHLGDIVGQVCIGQGRIASAGRHVDFGRIQGMGGRAPRLDKLNELGV
jgi:multisubunit Na+/H+ antiporter MnhC subunit